MENIVDLENVILGSILIENDSFNLVYPDLKPYCFEDSKNRIVYEAMCDVVATGGKIDYVTVIEKIKQKGLINSLEVNGANGSYYVVNLTSKVASSENIEYHSRLVIQNYLKNNLASVCQKTLIKTTERGLDIFELIDNLKKDVELSVDSVSNNKAFDTIESLADEFISDLNDKKMGLTELALTTGLSKLDAYGGLNKSDLIVVGARPGMGKTSFLNKLASNCAIVLNKPCGIISCEMTSKQLLVRLASSECQINSEKLRSGNVSDYELNQIYARINEIKKSPLYIDSKSRNLDTIISKSRRLKRNYKIELLMIDYLGLIRANGYRDKNSEITYITSELKNLAKELDIPIVLLSQLSREVEKRPLHDRMPRMSDLRDSGSIEQDADQILFLFRPEYYGVDTFEIDGQEQSIKNKCFVQYSKNRHGSVGTEIVNFNPHFTEFHNDYVEPKNQNNLTNDNFLSEVF